MRHKVLIYAASLVLASLATRANADTFQFTFGGPGVSGAVSLTYGTATDAKYPQAFEVTGISGTFSDSNIGITGASITGLEPVNHATPEPGNTLAPNDFSRFAVASGLPAQSNGFITYDNLFWPGGSPQTGSDYPFFGGFEDVYGLLFDLGNGQVVNFWSNGITPGAVSPDYGVAVASSSTSLDYVGGGVSITPEPGTFGLLGTGLLGAVLRGRPAFLRRKS